MRINTIIIDDEQNNVENIATLLSRYCPEFEIRGTANSAAEGLELIELQKPDLVLLDIQMPGGSGFDLLNSLMSVRFEVIFITAYDQYGIQAIKFSALDYLLKPIDIGEFKKAMGKAKVRIQEREASKNIENLLEYLKAGSKEVPKIALPTFKETVYVRINQILRCEAEDNYTTFYLQNTEKITVCKTLKDFSDLLKPHNFVRTHQSHLVNLNYVKSLLKEDGGTLLLENLEKVPISRQNRDLVKSKLVALGS